MKIYLVGGAVRDKLLGLPVKERDWVVVGATEEGMLKLGYRQVGKEFPVFLHPKTKEEYALARMERKVTAGYKGFTFDTSATVTLEEDLIRRDLTINAMAEATDGTLIDPYHGKQDLENKILRHVSPAFSEDPVRILRVGRFLARYAQYGFEVASETVELMQDMVTAGEVNALVAERVWKELDRALMEKNPEKFFEILDKCGGLSILFPHFSIKSEGMHALIAATELNTNAMVRFASLLHDTEDPKNNISILCRRYRVPTAYRELALLTAIHYKSALSSKQFQADELLQLYTALDIFRREERFRHFIMACTAIAFARQIQFDAEQLIEGANVAKNVDVQTLIAEGLTGNDLARRLREERQKNLAKWVKLK